MKSSVWPVPLSAVFLLLGLSSCAVGPDYHRPEWPQASHFKEDGPWQTARPQDQQPRGDWWTVYGDAGLDALMKQVASSNQNVAAAGAQLREAQALLATVQAAVSPTLGLSLAGTRSQSAASASGLQAPPTHNVKLALNASWEADLWGQRGRHIEAGQASFEAAQADWQSALLSAQLTLAQTYFQLRTIEAQQVLLKETVEAYARSLEITRHRHQAGVVSRLDVVQAETQLESARTQASELSAQRARLEHALALLVGQLPAQFNLPALAARPGLPELPALPDLLPATLLERRPDVAASERRMAAANAAIGVARAAWFPSLSFSVSTGGQNSRFSELLTQPHRFWSLGPTLALSLLDGGARRAQEEGAVAAYDKNVAFYRQTVLTVFQEVEDNLASLRALREEIESQTRAVRAAEEARRIAENQYRAGILSYLNVVTTQTAALNARRTLLGLQGQALLSHATLLKNLGGGTETPSPHSP